MINEPMTCDGVFDQLGSYLEGELTEPVRLELEAHAASCPTCSSLLGDIDTIRHEASALPTLEPSRDLWAGITARIDAPVTSMEEARQARPTAQRRTWMRPSLAAAALILVTAGVTHYITRAFIAADRVEISSRTPGVTRATPTPPNEATAQFEPSATEPATSSVEPSSGSAALAANRSSTIRSGTNAVPKLTGAVPAMKETQPVYDQEIGKLRAIMRERRSQLDPKTVAVLEQSIAVIDSAIAQSRAALAKDPSSGFLANQLNQSLDKKVELLRTAALLPSRT
jgi:hypothetical protein